MVFLASKAAMAMYVNIKKPLPLVSASTKNHCAIHRRSLKSGTFPPRIAISRVARIARANH